MRPPEPPISHPFHIHINPFQIVEVFSPNQTVVRRKARPCRSTCSTTTRKPDDAQCYLDPNDPTTWKDCKNVDDPSEPRIWWDVFPIPSGTGATDANGQPIKDASGNPIMVPGFFRMRSRFVDFAGQYVMHCHILAHEDRGMMMMVQVARPARSRADAVQASLTSRARDVINQRGVANSVRVRQPDRRAYRQPEDVLR